VNSFILSCLKILKPGGKIVIGVPNNNPYIHKYDVYHTLNLPPHHMGLWDKNSLTHLQNFYPMKLTFLETEPNLNFDYWLDVVAKKVLKTHNFTRLMKKFKLYGLISDFQKYTEGRNLLSIYLKY
jgi:hypothetical protein